VLWWSLCNSTTNISTLGKANMPIIIDEVVISINVENRNDKTSTTVGQGGGQASAKQQIVEECVEQVMDILRQQQEP
jgi:hypothetical protein